VWVLGVGVACVAMAVGVWVCGCGCGLAWLWVLMYMGASMVYELSVLCVGWCGGVWGGNLVCAYMGGSVVGVNKWVGANRWACLSYVYRMDVGECGGVILTLPACVLSA
jgi:hypothetical protein